MDEEQIEFRLRRQHSPYFSLQNRVPAFPGIPYVAKRNSCPDDLRRPAMRQQLLEVWHKRSVRSSFAQKDETNQVSVHGD